MAIIKEPIEILPQGQAIKYFIARPPEKHPRKEYLENQLHRKTAGERGENKMRKKFQEFHLDENFAALWDIGLIDGDWKTQFDGLVMTEKCIIILDSKNVSEDLHFDEKTGEFIRMDSKGQRLILDNPVFQLNKNILFLRRWLRKRKIDVRVKGLIVYTANQCLFHSKPSGAPICKTYQMNDYLYNILHSLPPDPTPLKVNKIKRLIEASHSPYVRRPLCETYQIAYSDLQKGVYCASCKGYQVVRSKRNWVCLRCGAKNSTAHHFALQEYFSFVDDSVTNKEFREFCLLESSDVAKRILVQYDFEVFGETKSRRYRIKE
ncbi:nuclease-related domain-containing protein [Planococcus halotolerans]|uniref:nuclease-related domain-containing protein n=1 Tax=Planococcus halotolerans TaxID=2233542 RepID=UPI001057A3CE|nr:nuclease-related domain-containing protein [Planococcus halotolerans]